MVDAAAILDAASEDDARFHLQRCCGAASWVAGMLARRPYGSSAALSAAADEVLERMSPADYVEAFAHHPRIGEDARRMAERFTSTAAWSTDEQSAVGAASGDVLDALRDANAAYERRFGFIFIVCAAGLGAHAMIDRIAARMGNPPDVELRVAGRELARITKKRLEKIAP